MKQDIPYETLVPETLVLGEKLLEVQTCYLEIEPDFAGTARGRPK